ncbi:MAG: alpha-(1-_3)-arabinofuranosyltransferase family protein, partial [Catenulispora sp.]
MSVLWLLLGLVVFGNKWGQFTPDIKPEIYLSPGRAAGDLMSTWVVDQQLGLPNFNVGLAPVAGFVAALQGLGLDAWLSVRVLRLLLLVIAATGATALSRHVTGSHGTFMGRTVAGVLFVVNPYVVVAGDTLAITLPLAFLPWQVLFLLRSIEQPGWRWPAAFALTFVPMSGMNAGVVPLLQLIYLPAVVWYVVARGTALRSVVTPLVRCGLLAIVLSLYWLIPAVAARGVGYNVVNNSETYRGIAGPSSFSEVLRGLGLWVMYGRDGSGPWQPGFTAYLTGPLVIVSSFVLPFLFAASCLAVRGPVRRLASLMVLLAAVVMVGLHPPDGSAPVGVAMRALFDHVPGAAAFRTTNKAGAVLVLGMALMVGAAAPSIGRRQGGRRLAAGVAIVTALLVGSVWPAFSGGLYSDHLAIPSYWKAAATAVDKGDSSQRVWLIPGEVSSHYRWSRPRVDDIDKSLLSRPSVVHYTIPN